MSLDSFPARPGGRYEDKLNVELDWESIHESATKEEVATILFNCARVLNAIVHLHKEDLPKQTCASAELALGKLGRAS